MDRKVTERADLPPRHFRVAVTQFIREGASDLAEQKHPVQHRVTQDVFGVPALPGDGHAYASTEDPMTSGFDS